MSKLDQLKKVSEKIAKTTKGLIKPASEIVDYGVFTTPFPTVNTLIKGIPIARFTTIAGPFHTGKGAFCLQTIAYLMQQDPEFTVLWTDAENALDIDWAEKLGVDLERFFVQKYTKEQDTMEKLLDAALSTIKESQAISMWVIDSIGALVPRGDLYDSKDNEKGLEGDKMLNLQRKLGEFFRKANVMIAPSPDGTYKGCAVICIGQVYTVPDANASLEEVKGGNAFKHWTHLRLMFRRGPKSDWPEPKDIIGLDGLKKKRYYPGWSGRIKVEKTRLNGNEGQEVLLSFMLGRGFDSKNAAITAAFGLGLIPRAGAIYTSELFPDGKIKGRDNVVKFLLENEEVYTKLLSEIDKAIEKGIDITQLDGETEDVKDNI